MQVRYLLPIAAAILCPRTGWTEPASGPLAPLSGGPIVQVILGLGVVLALFGGLALLLRHLNPAYPSGGGQLKVLGGLSLGTRERVVLVQVGEEQVLVGVAPGRVQTLHVLEHPMPTRRDRAAESGFASQLKGLMAGARAREPDAG